MAIYDQDKEPNNLPAESPGPPSPNIVIDSRIDSSPRRVPNKTLATRRYEAQQAYGRRVPRKRGSN